MKYRLLLVAVVAFLAAALPLLSQPAPPTEQVTPYTVKFTDDAKPLPKGDDPVKTEKPKYARGHNPLTAAQKAAIHAERKRALGNHVEKLPKATAPAWDCRALGFVLPADDQMQCGSCYGVSTANCISMALIKAGILPNDASKGRLSSQYGLDNGSAFSGGCDGGNGTQVIDYCMKHGWPLTSDYGPYRGSPGRLKDISGMKLFKPVNWGFCTPGQEDGIASVQDIKNCIARYGVVNFSFDAGGCDNYSWPNVMKGRGNNVDHEVNYIGWDDAKSAFLCINQWKDWGGPDDTFWLDYNSYSSGTSSFWVDGGGAPPPPPPPPPGPGPNPGNVVALPSGTYTVSTDAAGVITFTPSASVSLDTTFRDVLKILNPPTPTPKTDAEILDALRKLLVPKP